MLCGQIPALEVVQAFNDPIIFLAQKDVLDFDLCITDIEMPGIDGLTLARAHQGKQVIFVTAYKEYAADAFEIEALDYLTKPIKIDRLEKAVQKCLSVLANSRNDVAFVQVNTDKGRSFLYFSNVAIISASKQDSRDKKVTMRDGTSVLIKNMTFGQLLDLLPENDFCRINKKEIISVSAIKHYAHNEVVILVDNSSIRVAISETYRREFLTKARLAGLIT
ncbi:MAG: response regulator transcription factor [Chitinophagaceae bacterium]|nr:MAG: response regulator transcription factor [Chitinophagaceae bacterium]